MLCRLSSMQHDELLAGSLHLSLECVAKGAVVGVAASWMHSLIMTLIVLIFCWRIMCVCVDVGFNVNYFCGLFGHKALKVAQNIFLNIRKLAPPFKQEKNSLLILDFAAWWLLTWMQADITFSYFVLHLNTFVYCCLPYATLPTLYYTGTHCRLL